MKLVEIPIGRFQAETPLSRETYLFLPLNNKTIRIGWAGDVISESMLARLLSKGHTHLRIGEESDIDPETFPVHRSEEEARPPEAAPAAVSPRPDADQETITALPPSPTEENILVKDNGSPSEPSQSFSPEPHAAEEAASVGGNLSEKETETKLRASAMEENEAESHFGTEEEKERYIRKFTAEKGSLPAVVRLQQKLQETDGEELSIDLSAEKESALKEAKSVILSSKISEKIIALSEQAQAADSNLRSALREQVRSLKASLDRVDKGDLSQEEEAELETKEEIASVTESLASASRAEQVEEITERLSAHALTRKLALAALEDQEKTQESDEAARGAANRDLPVTISRLAAYLGHSLGYTNVDFLADLACGAIAHFAKKEGEELDESLLPSFSRRVVSSEDSPLDETIADSKEILRFLDVYIEDKECDRSHKDLMKRVFDRTLHELSERDDGPSSLTKKKWSSFAERGPTMDSHSLCTRASAKAVKAARSAHK
jgi:hypothetical protein